MKPLSHITESTKSAFLFAMAAVVGLALLYTVVEPQITHSQTTETFTIKTQVTGESSFLVPPSDITMVGTLNGLTGGSATGSTQFVVQSNSATGYTVEISFENNGTDNAMLGDATGDEAIHDYGGDVAGEPSFGITASTSAQFAYTATSTVLSDTPQSFRENAGTCNDAGGTAVGTCWKSPETTDFLVASRSSPASGGATSTILFNVTVPNNPSPIPAAEGYTATATLSLISI